MYYYHANQCISGPYAPAWVHPGLGHLVLPGQASPGPVHTARPGPTHAIVAWDAAAYPPTGCRKLPPPPTHIQNLKPLYAVLSFGWRGGKEPWKGEGMGLRERAQRGPHPLPLQMHCKRKHVQPFRLSSLFGWTMCQCPAFLSESIFPGFCILKTI
jgi:hypothetical protein